MPTRITKAEFCRLITGSPSTFMGTTRGIVSPECIRMDAYTDPTYLTEIREATLRSRDIVFSGGSHLEIVNREFHRYDIAGKIVLVCSIPEDNGICCYYLLRN